MMADRIPEGWRECKIENLAKRITSGGTPLTKVKEYYGGEIPWLNTKEISFNRITDTEVKITKLGLNNSSAKWIDPNSVIVAMYGATAGKIAINKIPLTTNQACCNLTIDETIADYNFVYYCLRNSYDELENLASGAAQQNLNVGIISDFEILLPSLPEQHAIASVLSSLDDKIDLLNRENQTLEQMAEALFRQWFIEEADEEWEEGKLGDVLAVIESGKRPKGGIDPDLENGIPSIGAENINGIGHYDYSKTKLVNEVFFQSMKKGIIKDYDVLIYKDGAYVGRKGMFGLKYPYDICTVNEHVFILRANDKLNQFFLYFILEQEALSQLNSNSAQPGLNQETIKSLDITIPPKVLVEEFSNMVKPWIDKILINAKQIRTLEKLRDTLLPKLMSGEVRVKICDA
jgi:type I restriction enzyme S subunit